MIRLRQKSCKKWHSNCYNQQFYVVLTANRMLSEINQHDVTIYKHYQLTVVTSHTAIVSENH